MHGAWWSPAHSGIPAFGASPSQIFSLARGRLVFQGTLGICVGGVLSVTPGYFAVVFFAERGWVGTQRPECDSSLPDTPRLSHGGRKGSDESNFHSKGWLFLVGPGSSGSRRKPLTLDIEARYGHAEPQLRSSPLLPVPRKPEVETQSALMG